MNIIICGAGKVGFSISKQLSAQGHSVTVIDQSSEDIKKINDTLRLIENDDYGYCMQCGEEIGLNRLQERPTATLCIDCNKLVEIREKQMAK